MTGNKDHFVTKDGLQKLQDELEYLEKVKRKEIAERISEAKELGDLSENAEYSDAKDEQALTEARVIELKNMIKNAQIISHRKNTKNVQIGSTIEVKGPGGKTMKLTIVGSSEADPTKNMISNESPLGKAFLDKEVGEKVSVQTPGGEMKYEILSAE